jgi:hypothetical protein
MVIWAGPAFPPMNRKFMGTMREKFFGEVSFWDGAPSLERLWPRLWPAGT